jgi:toxin HigB-1
MNTYQQCWKACWGQPLKSSNLLSSAGLTTKLRQRPVWAKVGVGVVVGPLVQDRGQRCLRAACGQILLGDEQQDQVALGGEVGHVLGHDGPAVGPGSRRNESVLGTLESRLGKSCPSDLVRVGRRKLDQLNQAEVLGDLRAPPSNRLEKLKGEREGQYSIRINDQWRVCFRWTELGAEDVEIVDYH